MDAITYPKVVLDGTTYYIKVSLASLRRLRENGIEADTPAPDPNNFAETSRYLSITFSACSFLEVNGKLRPAGLSIEEAEELLEPKDFALLNDALQLSLVKALPAVASPVQPAAVN